MAKRRVDRRGILLPESGPIEPDAVFDPGELAGMSPRGLPGNWWPCPDINCCPPLECGADCDCSFCITNTTPCCWKVVIAGITNGASPSCDCDELNGTYYLSQYQVSSCIWQRTFTLCGGCSEVKIVLEATEGAGSHVITVSLVDGSNIVLHSWKHDFGANDINCCAVDQYLTHDVETVDCVSTGATCKITALGDIIRCNAQTSCCACDCLQVTISGLSVGECDCPDCKTLNDVAFNIPGRARGEDGAPTSTVCRWRGSWCDASPPPYSVCDYDSFEVNLRRDGSQYYVEAVLSQIALGLPGQKPTITWKKAYAMDEVPDCTTWSGEVLSFDSEDATGTTTPCTATGSTVSITTVDGAACTYTACTDDPTPDPCGFGCYEGFNPTEIQVTFDPAVFTDGSGVGCTWRYYDGFGTTCFDGPSGSNLAASLNGQTFILQQSATKCWLYEYQSAGYKSVCGTCDDLDYYCCQAFRIELTLANEPWGGYPGSPFLIIYTPCSEPRGTFLEGFGPLVPGALGWAIPDRCLDVSCYISPGAKADVYGSSGNTLRCVWYNGWAHLEVLS